MFIQFSLRCCTFTDQSPNNYVNDQNCDLKCITLGWGNHRYAAHNGPDSEGIC